MRALTLNELRARIDEALILYNSTLDEYAEVRLRALDLALSWVSVEFLDSHIKPAGEYDVYVYGRDILLGEEEE